MKGSHELILATIIILVLIYVFYDKTTPVMVNNYETYNVLEKFPDYKQAALNLSTLNNKIITYLKYLKDKYKINNNYNDYDDVLIRDMDKFMDPGVQKRKDYKRQIVNMMLRNYNPEAIVETDPETSSDTSYTVSKGKILYVCLREKKAPFRLQNTNDILFVLLHELAHMGNNTWGHGKAFWTVFKFVLQEANNCGIYDPIDYSRDPRPYCGLTINYSPYYDGNLQTL